MEQQNKTVLLAAPISSRDWVLPYYLDSIYSLDYPKHLLSIYWLLNNSIDQSKKLLQQFKSQHQNEYKQIIIEEKNNPKIPKDERVTQTRHAVYPWLAHLRNMILQKTISLNVDFLYSSDCDIILKADSLKRLLAHNTPIVSNLLYNGYLFSGIDTAWKFPNILKETSPRQYQHIANYRIKNPDKNPIGTLLQVEFTGASILISKEVCKVAKYDTNLQFGEDEVFSYSARQAGYKLYCDISSYQQHIMSPEILQLYLDGKL